MAKTSMSVRDMGRLLGIGKTESYWLVKKNVFEVRIVAGNMRVMIDSFEKWYAGQFHYHKITGEIPGTRWDKTTLSIKDAATILGIAESTVYEVLKRKNIRTRVIDNRTRIDRESFYGWLDSQNVYPRNKGKEVVNV